MSPGTSVHRSCVYKGKGLVLPWLQRGHAHGWLLLKQRVTARSVGTGEGGLRIQQRSYT